tara:strand:- start:119 stop:424 length:306 start_codon:yes stop_codon:yes gene_type:complete
VAKEEIPSNEVNAKRIGCWQLSALCIYGVLIVLSIPLVEGLYLHFLSSKRICNQVLAEEISQRQASEFLIRKGWRVGGGEDSILYMCDAYLKANDEVKGKQ